MAEGPNPTQPNPTQFRHSVIPSQRVPIHRLQTQVLVQSAAVRAFDKQDAVAKEFKDEYEVFYKVHRKHRKFELGTIWKCHWYNGAIYYSLLAFGPVWVISQGLLTAAKFIVVVKLYSSVDKYTVQLLRGERLRPQGINPRALWKYQVGSRCCALTPIGRRIFSGYSVDARC